MSCSKLFLFLMSFICYSSHGQVKTTPVVKTMDIRSTKGSGSGHYEYNRNGDKTFSWEESLYEPVSIIEAYDYDSFGRETRAYLYQSEVGFIVYDKEYSGNKTFIRDYNCEFPAEEKIRKIKTSGLSREKFIASKEFRKILNAENHVANIIVTDSLKRTETEFFLSQEGDTSKVYITFKNAFWNDSLLSYYSKESDKLNWNIFWLYDTEQHLVSTKRVEADGSISENWEYSYDSKGLISKEICFYRGEFKSAQQFNYDSDGKPTEELLYEGDPEKIKVRTLLETGEYDRLIRSIEFDSRNGLQQETRREYSYTFY